MYPEGWLHIPFLPVRLRPHARRAVRDVKRTGKSVLLFTTLRGYGRTGILTRLRPHARLAVQGVKRTGKSVLLFTSLRGYGRTGFPTRLRPHARGAVQDVQRTGKSVLLFAPLRGYRRTGFLTRLRPHSGIPAIRVSNLFSFLKNVLPLRQLGLRRVLADVFKHFEEMALTPNQAVPILILPQSSF